MANRFSRGFVIGLLSILHVTTTTSIPVMSKEMLPIVYPNTGHNLFDEVRGRPANRPTVVPSESNCSGGASEQSPQQRVPNAEPHYTQRCVQNAGPQYTQQYVQNAGPQYPQRVQNAGPQYTQRVQNAGPQYPQRVQNAGPQYTQRVQNAGPQYPQRVQNAGPQYTQRVQNAGPQHPEQNMANCISRGCGNEPLYIPEPQPPGTIPTEVRVKQIVPIVDPDTGHNLFDEVRGRPANRPTVVPSESNCSGGASERIPKPCVQNAEPQHPEQNMANCISRGFCGNEPLYIPQQPQPPGTIPTEVRVKQIVPIVDPDTGHNLFDEVRGRPANRPTVVPSESNCSGGASERIPKQWVQNAEPQHPEQNMANCISRGFCGNEPLYIPEPQPPGTIPTEERVKQIVPIVDPDTGHNLFDEVRGRPVNRPTVVPSELNCSGGASERIPKPCVQNAEPQHPEQNMANCISRGFCGNEPLYIPEPQPPGTIPTEERVKQIVPIVDPDTGHNLFDEVRGRPVNRPTVVPSESNFSGGASEVNSPSPKELTVTKAVGMDGRIFHRFQDENSENPVLTYYGSQIMYYPNTANDGMVDSQPDEIEGKRNVAYKSSRRELHLTSGEVTAVDVVLDSPDMRIVTSKQSCILYERINQINETKEMQSDWCPNIEIVMSSMQTQQMEDALNWNENDPYSLIEGRRTLKIGPFYIEEPIIDALEGDVNGVILDVYLFWLTIEFTRTTRKNMFFLDFKKMTAMMLHGNSPNMNDESMSHCEEAEFIIGAILLYKHWILCVIDKRHGDLLILDPLKEKVSDELKTKIERNWSLCKNHITKKQDAHDWKVRDRRHPLQGEKYDSSCGIFVTLYLEYFIQAMEQPDQDIGLPDHFDNEEISKARFRIANTLKQLSFKEMELKKVALEKSKATSEVEINVASNKPPRRELHLIRGEMTAAAEGDTQDVRVVFIEQDRIMNERINPFTNGNVNTGARPKTYPVEMELKKLPLEKKKATEFLKSLATSEVESNVASNKPSRRELHLTRGEMTAAAENDTQDVRVVTNKQSRIMNERISQFTNGNVDTGARPKTYPVEKLPLEKKKATEFLKSLVTSEVESNVVSNKPPRRELHLTRGEMTAAAEDYTQDVRVVTNKQSRIMIERISQFTNGNVDTGARPKTYPVEKLPLEKKKATEFLKSLVTSEVESNVAPNKPPRRELHLTRRDDSSTRL